MPLQISGLVSGMDTESIIKDMMKAKLAQVDKVKQQRQILEWKRDSYRDTNMKIFNFRNSILDLKLESTFNSKQVEVSDNTVLAAIAKSNAPNGTHIIKVNSLMSGVTRISQSALAEYKDTLAEQFGITDTVTFTLKGKDGVSHAYSFDTASKSINDVVKEINDNASASGISAGYSADGNRFIISTTDKGAGEVIELEADPDSFINSTLKLGMAEGVYQGTDASIDFDGATGITFTSNQFTLNDINFDLKKAGETVSITISHDIENGVAKIKSFVEAYNALMENINVKLNERREYDKSSHSFKYQPLTDAQRKEMSEKEIEKWEAAAKKGIMNNESILRSLAAEIQMTTNNILKNNDDLVYEAGVNLYSRTALSAYAGTLADQFGITGTVGFTLKGEDGVDRAYSFDSATQNINDVVNAINANSAYSGIEAHYSTIDNSFRLTTLNKSPDARLEIVADGDLFLKSTLKLEVNTGVYKPGSNLIGYSKDVKDLPFTSLSAIGIGTGGYLTGSKDNGKLVIDENKLREALQADPEGVMDLFNLTQTVLVDGKVKTYDVGLALKINTMVNAAVSRINAKAGTADAVYDNSFLTADITRIGERISTLEERMKALELRYRRQFAAMEKAIHWANMQSQWLSQKIGDLQGSNQ